MPVTQTEEPALDLCPRDCLVLAWPSVAECLVPASQRPRLEAAARRLPPISRLALEVRLGAEDGDVDLHQFISCAGRDALVLARHLERGGTDSAMDPLTGFLRDWCREGGMRRDMEGFFLEWDRPGAASVAPQPALFLPVQRRHERGDAGIAARSRVAGHIRRLGLAGAEGADLVERSFRAVPETVSISYAGLMLGRGNAVRINLRSIRPDDLEGILDALGWSGGKQVASSWFRKLVERADQVAVALDFGPEIRPTIGFEAALDARPESEPRWSGVLDELFAQRLCTGEKRAALEQAGARLYPEEEGQDWPAAWALAAAAAPERFVPWFEHRLSHVKVSVGADNRVGAKAYLSAQHVWSRSPPLAARSGPRSAGPSGRGVQAGAARAANFLLSARGQDDLWRDFAIVNGASDEWVSGFVGLALARGGINLPSEALDQTKAMLLRRRRPCGGWGYNAHSPADADSTAWVLKFFDAIGYAGPELAQARRFLISHRLPDGGFATYAPATSISFGQVGDLSDQSGWRGSHLCVAANAAAVLDGALDGSLLGGQSSDGSWEAYWWRSDALATALAVHSLRRVEGSQEALARALGWARRQGSTSSPFDIAWLVQILCAGGDEDRRLAAGLAETLLAQQEEDGGWPASASMLFPAPSVRSRGASSPCVFDERRCFTSASVLMALSELTRSGI